MHRALRSVLLATLTACAMPVTAIAAPGFSSIALDASAGDDARVYSQADSSTLVSGLDVFILAGLDRQAKNRGGLAALTAQLLLDTPIDDGGETLSLQDAIEHRGATITAGVEGQSVHFYIEARNADLAEVTALFARVLAAPSFTKATFESARTAIRSRIEASRGSGLAIGTLMFRDAYYSTSNAGQAPLGTIADLDRLRTADTAEFFHTAYRRGGANATLIGDVNDANKAAAKDLLYMLAEGKSAAVVVSGRPALAPQTSIITFRKVSSPWVLLGFPAPSANSDDFGAMLVLNAILEDTFVRQSTTSVPASERAVGLSYDFHSSPANVLLYVDGGAVDQAMALRELGVLRLALGSTVLNSDYVNRYKRIALGQYINDNAALPHRAQEISNLAHLGLGADGVNVVLRKIDRVTSRDLQRVIKKYFDASTAAFVIPRAEEHR